MHFIKRALPRMFGLGFGSGGGEAGDDSDKENKSESPPPSNRPPPWLKKLKVSEENEDSGTGHSKLVSNIRFVKICQ